MSSLSDENKQAVNVMLGLAPGLVNAYLLKEKFYFFMDAKDSYDAQKRLKEFFIFAKQLNVSEYDACIRMLTNWKDYMVPSRILRKLVCSLVKILSASYEIRLKAGNFQVLHIHIFFVAPLCTGNMA